VSPKVKDEAWAGDPLPRGRHKLPRETVTASQRERLLRAMGEIVGELGYDGASVPKVIARARVSSNTFYRFFSDKTDCFIALCEDLGNQLFEQLASIGGDANTPEEALEALNRGLRAYLQWWPDRPALARAYFVELPSAGPRALDERDRQIERFEAVLRFTAERARAFYPDAPPLRDVDVTAAATITRELVASHIRAGRVDHLDEIEDDMRYLLIKLLVDDATAQRAVTATKRKRRR
jgi:AcrR family transcriptional regulator